MKRFPIFFAPAFLGVAITAITDIGALLHLPSLSFVLVLTFCITLSRHPFTHLRDACIASLKGTEVAMGALAQHRACFSTLRQSALGVGIVGTFIGLVKMLADLSEPDTLGPSLSHALLSVLYGAIFAEMIAAPLAAALEQVEDSREQCVPWGRYLVAGTLSIGAIVAFMLSGGAVPIFIDVTSLCLIMGCGSLIIIGQFGFRGTVWALRAGASDFSLSADAAGHFGRVLETMRARVLSMGFIGFLTGLILILAALKEPSALGPAVAVALLSSMYALAISELFLAPMVNSMSGRVLDGKPPSGLVIQSSLIPMLLFLMAMLLFFFAMVSVLT